MNKYKIFILIVLALVSGICFFIYNQKISVSVIVPVYNSEKYLEICLDSLEKQTLDSIEFIVIDDGSTDKSYDIMQKYAKKDKRFKIYSKENEGVGKTRNLGIKLAKGEYIGFVDSDDYVSNDYFGELYNVAKKYDADVSITSNVIYVKGNEHQRKWRAISKVDNKEFFNDLSFLIDDAGEQWDKIYKKSFLKKNIIKSYEERLWFEDIWFSTLVAIYAKKIVIDTKGVYFYNVREGSLSAVWDTSGKYLLQGLGMYKKIFERVSLMDITDGRRHILYMKLRNKVSMFIGIFHEVYNKDEEIRDKVGVYFQDFENIVHKKR